MSEELPSVLGIYLPTRPLTTYIDTILFLNQEGSSNVWSVLAEDWKGGCPIRVSFGADGLFWGEKEWMTPADGQHLVQAFGKRPQSMIAMAATLHPTLKSFETNFVALGPKGSWIVGTQWGSPFWTGIPKALEDTIKRELKVGHTIVVSCVRFRSSSLADVFITPI